MPPSGAVSSTADAATTVGVRERRQRRARGGEVAGPVAEVAAERDVRALGGRRPSSGLHHEVPAIRWRSAATSPSSRMAPLEVGLSAGGLGRALRQGLGLAQRPAELAATCRICPVSPSTARSWSAAVAAMARAWRPGLAGRADDRVERLRGVRAQLLHAGHGLPSPLHLPAHRRHLVGDLLEQRAAPRPPRAGSARRDPAPRRPPPRSRGPPRPARAASIAALSAIRLVRSAISRIVPMKPLIRLVIAPRPATWSALAETKPLSPTSRSIASPMTAAVLGRHLGGRAARRRGLRALIRHGARGGAERVGRLRARRRRRSPARSRPAASPATRRPARAPRRGASR